MNNIRGGQVTSAADELLCHNSLRVTWCKNCEEVIGLRIGADGPAQWCPIDDGCAYCGDNASVDMSIADFLSGIRRP
jgi:hypothetical protein